MSAPRITARSMITAGAVRAGWVMAYENTAATGYVRRGALLTVLWTTDDDLFAATLASGGAPMPERLGVTPHGDTYAAQAVVLGWLHDRTDARPEVAVISSPPSVVGGLDSALRAAMREQIS
ncbi:hypothetical protein ACFXG4_08585 [Nocardia sp. NPDC059246]|uniref:hypothetical protein n=1 Tax=unclassified Nocardia TaxID=2637762 RepID=UPI003691052F